MKKIFLISILSFISITGLFAAKGVSKSKDGNFTKTYDAVQDATFYEHKDLETSGFYNLMDSATGERVNLSVYISVSNNAPALILDAKYQSMKWLFLNEVVIFSDDERLSVKSNDRITDIVSSTALKEEIQITLNTDEIEKLKTILNSKKVECSYIGSKNKRTKVLTVKPKIKAAILETIAKLETL